MVKKDEVFQIPLEWHVPDNIIARYATNVTVQRSENEFIISFFEVMPPLMIGQQEDVVRKTKELKSVRANCIARIIVATERMPQFIEAMQKIWDDHSEHTAE